MNFLSLLHRRWCARIRAMVGLALIAVGSGATAQAPALSADESRALATQVRELTRAYERGDAEAIVSRTHPSLIAASGGADKFRALLSQALQQQRSSGVVYEQQDVQAPERLHDAGDQWLAVVPRTSVLKFGERRAESHGFMLAARPKSGGAWTFIDGAGLRKNPAVLRQLFPRLEPGVALPRNEVVPLNR